MKKLLSVLAALTATLALAGVASAQEATGTATVLHGIPGATVDVYVNDALTLEAFEFGTVTDPLELPEGDYAIDIRAAGEPDSDPIISGSTTLPAGANASIIAHLAEDGTPTLAVFVNDTSSIAAGDARLAVRHVAAAPTVDVLANGDVLVPSLSNPDEAALDVPAATYSVAVAPAGSDSAVLGPLDVTLADGTATLVYAVGSLDDGSLDVLVQTIEGLGSAPAGVPSGTSGLVDDGGFPLWAIAILVLAGLGAVASGAAFAYGRGRA
jgi:hypothetical protein